MRVLFIARSTLYSAYGGDTVQITSTAKYLRRLGVYVDIRLSHEHVDHSSYDLLHIFNIIRPADALKHIKHSRLPYVISTIFLDHSEYQKQGTGIRNIASKFISPDGMEYMKALARWIKNGESIKSTEYLLYGHKRSVQILTGKASYLLPNSLNEYYRLVDRYKTPMPQYKVVYNGIDPELFAGHEPLIGNHDPLQVACAARIEGNKNQLTLIRALNNTRFHLKLIGKPAPNHLEYYDQCKKAAASNVSFEGFVPQDELIQHLLSAKVHILPSWNETCGLSSLEAAYLGCNIVVTAKGDTVEYYGDNAWYCDPGDPESIYNAIVKAAEAPVANTLYDQIMSTYNWHEAAMGTLSVYEEVLGMKLLKKEAHNAPEAYK